MVLITRKFLQQSIVLYKRSQKTKMNDFYLVFKWILQGLVVGSRSCGGDRNLKQIFFTMLKKTSWILLKKKDEIL